MLDFTFLTIKQIFGTYSEDKLGIIEKIGMKAAMTDFAILLGGTVDSFYNGIEINPLEKIKGYYWTRSSDGNNKAYIIGYRGISSGACVDDRDIGIRPALPYSSIRNISLNEERENGILEVEYGEYPQKAVSKGLQDKLERAYEQSSIKKTGKTYTTYPRKYDEYNKEFRAQIIEEYSFDDEKKYVRVKANSYFDDDSSFGLSNGERYRSGDYVWVEVKPIKWLIDEKNDIALSKRVLFAGVPFQYDGNYTGDFRTTTIKQFMDNSFSKEILVEQYQNLEEKELRRKQDPYNFNFDEVSEEDIIKGALMSNVSVFLHGRSSEGKSARVKQFDPDCEIIYLRNATPDSLNGKSVYNSETGEMIDVPPTWYKKICKKCEDEPNKIHIIFFDEITNALPSIQGMAFNIILDGEINGIWKLPKNARIVAAGNDLNDSLAANTMAEPLFNRFAHVYINTTVDSWLKWASTPNEEYERLDYKDQKPKMKIHPAIYSYVAYKSYSKKDVLRTPYNGEKPNADPRKWEMASKVLYATGKPEMLRSLVGEDLTKDFVEFCKQKIITVEDVINNNYNDSDIKISVSEKYATAVGLSSVDENNLEVVREFVYKLGAEIGATFDSIWAHGDEIRLEKLAEIKLAKTKSL